MESNDRRPTNPGTSPNKLLFYKVERLIQKIIEKGNIKRNNDVRDLYLANEEITDIPPLDNYRFLSRLWLQNNKIKKLDFFQNNKTLSEIYLQNNLIQDIKYCFRNISHLRVLYLNGNQIYNLDDVTTELSYLNYLKDLNLYDNPIALEKNYRNRLVHKIPSLRCIDRDIITKNEIADSRNMFENDRIEIESRYAFLRCLENSENSNLNITNLPRLKNKNSINTARTLTDSNKLEESKIFKEETNKKKNYPRTIQEYSYFDWSKVKLFENKHKEDEFRASTAMHLQLQQMNKAAEEDELEMPQDLYKSESNNDINQVITITFQ